MTPRHDDEEQGRSRTVHDPALHAELSREIDAAEREMREQDARARRPRLPQLKPKEEDRAANTKEAEIIKAGDPDLTEVEQALVEQAERELAQREAGGRGEPATAEPLRRDADELLSDLLPDRVPASPMTSVAMALRASPRATPRGELSVVVHMDPDDVHQLTAEIYETSDAGVRSLLVDGLKGHLHESLTIDDLARVKGWLVSITDQPDGRVMYWVLGTAESQGAERPTAIAALTLTTAA